ncbi:MAG: hypothetical protein JW844_08275 [Candidatus Omnitrophica bacterium]|nr:hypothetical protein [Candidatus Omnitrophota bacterium]
MKKSFPNLKQLKRVSLKVRKSQFRQENIARVAPHGLSFSEFLGSLPEVLAARDLHYLIDSVIKARKKKKTVLLMCGAHVIKCGLSRFIIELLEKNIVTAIALNGAGAIHDFELSYAGATSEHVASAIQDGAFGMSIETSRFLNQAVRKGAQKGEGMGYAIGRMIHTKKLPYRDISLLGCAYRRQVPATVHVALGTDIIHQHPECDGASIGAASLRDFHILCAQVPGLNEGGVVINFGSAVILPEVFLKAVSISRNLGRPVRNFTAADFDMLRQYRPTENIVRRPLSGPRARGMSITGHHEIMLPLFAYGILEAMEKGRRHG